jgi:tetratricopeptide (TPR) repeat protein
MVAAFVVALALASPKASEEARALAQRSIVEYDAGDFDKALADAQQAYELDPIPGILFNLGQCHRALRHWDRAEFFYRGYLRKKPDAKNRQEVIALIAEMQAKEKEQAAPPPSAAPAPGPILVEAAPPPVAMPTGSSAPTAAITETPSRPVPVGAWVTGGLGVAAIAVGVVFAVLASNLSSQDTKQPASGVWVHSLSQSAFQNENSDAIATNSLIYGGAAVLAGGVLWGIFGRGSASATSAAVP